MVTLKNLIDTTPDTIRIDWKKVEETVGFSLHSDLKTFYLRLLCGEQKKISGKFILVEEKFIKKT